MNILDETRIATDVYRYNSYEEQKVILEYLNSCDSVDIDSIEGIIIVRHNSDGCGESWEEVQIVDLLEIY